MRVEPAVTPRESDRTKLQKVARGRATAANVVSRAKIILLAAKGMQNRDIAFGIETTVTTVALWRRRYLRFGLPGILKDTTRPSRRPRDRRLTDEQIIEKTTQTAPQNATQWSTLALAAEIGVDHVFVHRVWTAHGLEPHRVRTFKPSNATEADNYATHKHP